MLTRQFEFCYIELKVRIGMGKTVAFGNLCSYFFFYSSRIINLDGYEICTFHGEYAVLIFE